MGALHLQTYTSLPTEIPHKSVKEYYDDGLVSRDISSLILPLLIVEKIVAMHPHSVNGPAYTVYWDLSSSGKFNLAATIKFCKMALLHCLNRGVI